MTTCVSQLTGAALPGHDWKPLKDMPDKFEHCANCGLVRVKLLSPVQWVQDGNEWHGYRDGEDTGRVIAMSEAGMFLTNGVAFATFNDAVKANDF